MFRNITNTENPLIPIKEPEDLGPRFRTKKIIYKMHIKNCLLFSSYLVKCNYNPLKNQMEKLILKSNSQEVALNPKDNSICESFIYEPVGLPDKKLGSIYILGHIEKHPKEDIGYILNLISSLMKREYYADPSSGPKAAFERGLKKLNEVLKDFFRDKEVDLDLGILAIAGESMLISKLGKFKILLYRSGDFIDIFNNVGLFSKEKVQEEEFSNVVSGKLAGSDSVFAYHPNRQTATREKKIKDTIKASVTSVDFVKGMKQLQSKSSFPCHGIYLSLEETKETASIPRAVVSSDSSDNQRAGVQNMLKELPDIKDKKEDSQKPTEEQEQPEISPAELSMAKRETGIDKLFSKTKNIKTMKPTHKFTVGALAIAIAIGGFMTYKTLNKSSAEFKAAKQTAEEGLQQAEQKLAVNNVREARAALTAALIGLEQYKDDKEAQELIAEVEEKLGLIDNFSTKQAMLLIDLAEESVSATHIIKTPNSLYVFDKETESFNSLNGNLEGDTVYVFVTPTEIHFADGEDVYNKTLEEDIVTGDFYADNFYFANSEGIFKYADIAMTSTKKTDWLKEEYTNSIISLVVDNSIYTLTSDGKFIEYFGGKKEQVIDLQINPGSDAQILTKEESEKLFVFDPQIKQIKSFQRDDGSLIETFDISYIENPQSISLGNSDELYILSSDNKIWKL